MIGAAAPGTPWLTAKELTEIAMVPKNSPMARLSRASRTKAGRSSGRRVRGRAACARAGGGAVRRWTASAPPPPRIRAAATALARVASPAAPSEVTRTGPRRKLAAFARDSREKAAGSSSSRPPRSRWAQRAADKAPSCGTTAPAHVAAVIKAAGVVEARTQAMAAPWARRENGRTRF